MKMKRTVIVLIFIVLAMVFAQQVFPYKSYIQFNKGIAYLLIGDKELALKHLGLFFKEYPDPALRSGFVHLVQSSDWEVTKEFKRYLDINHRSVPALVGIALSTSDMANSTSIDNLQRTIRMQPSFSAAYLSLGMQYMKRKNYPLANTYFSRAIRISGIPEYKILPAKLHLLLNEPEKALSLMKPEADRSPDNFYFNYLTAQAYIQLNQLDAMGRYIESAIEVNPKNNDAQLLLAKYLLNKDQLKRAKSILKPLRFNDYNEDYVKTYGRVLLGLKDRKAKNYLDEVYSKKKWDKEINELMGLFYLGKGDKGNVQNWINRAILSGNSVERLQQAFPGKYKFPEYNYTSFFDINTIKWISDEIVLVGAKKNSGDKEKLFFIQCKELKILDTLSYNGEVQDIFISDDRSKVIFSTTADKKESVYLYAIEISDHNFKLQPLYLRPLPISSAVVGFNKAGNLAYITDGTIASLAFDSPFAIVSELGERKPLYPHYPFPLYQYNFVTRRLVGIKDLSQAGTIPIEYVKKYLRVLVGYQSKNSVQQLIEKAQGFDLTSFKIVKIHFADDLSAFVIYLSDLKNAFQAVIYDHNKNKIFTVDETMFLGEGEYAEIQLLHFDPRKKDILLVTTDKSRTLIKFNYGSFLYTRYASNVIESHYEPVQDMIYTLTERSKKSFFTETNLGIFSVNPYTAKTVDTQRDLDKILSVTEDLQVYFSTFNGEVLKMDQEYKFHYIGPSFAGSLHAVSPSNKKMAAFINGRLFVLDSPY